MSGSRTGDPVDADRWLVVHEDEVIGAARDAAVDLVERAGLVSHVADHRGVAPEPSVPDPGRIRLIIGDDGMVQWARSG